MLLHVNFLPRQHLKQVQQIQTLNILEISTSIATRTTWRQRTGMRRKEMRGIQKATQQVDVRALQLVLHMHESSIGEF
jgi:hypothetical protein